MSPVANHYTARDALETYYSYLGNSITNTSIVDNTQKRGRLLEFSNGEKAYVFICPIVHKQDNSKNYIDTRDSGARGRKITWDCAKANNTKYFCLAVNDRVEKYRDYIFSLECDEQQIAVLSGTVNGVRNGRGNQIIIPNNFVPGKKFERIQNNLEVYISAIHKDVFTEYVKYFDNNPYSQSELQVETLDPEQQEKRFRIWLKSLTGESGTAYDTGTIDNYITHMKEGYTRFGAYENHDSIFSIQEAESVSKYLQNLINNQDFLRFDRDSSNNCSNGLKKYIVFLGFEFASYYTTVKAEYPLNLIVFGAPGTGKSFALKEYAKKLLNGDKSRMERVTFHSDYTNAQFFGTYKPVTDNTGEIRYEFVPGPFMRIYIAAIKNSMTGNNPKAFLLIIEEINRARMAAVFGEIFQLLDRDECGVSEYPVCAPEELRKYLADELGGFPNDYKYIMLPNNLFIWATMNSADQGVYPMDTAFKRRWDFRYIGIDENEDKIHGLTVVLPKEGGEETIIWNQLRKAINAKLLKVCRVNEDKLLGPFFLSGKVLSADEQGRLNNDVFIKAFESKVLMYLYEDAARRFRNRIFDEQFSEKYSDVCKAFERYGIRVFGRNFKEEYYEEMSDN